MKDRKNRGRESGIGKGKQNRGGDRAGTEKGTAGQADRVQDVTHDTSDRTKYETAGEAKRTE
jgi:hypothetical protein